VGARGVVEGGGLKAEGAVAGDAAKAVVGESSSQGMVLTASLDRRLQVALWLVLVVFSLQGVFGHSLWGGNDSREGGMIWDMYRHQTYVTPIINGQPFLEKPPLLHWTALLVCRAAGRVTEGLLRLPAALYGFGTLVLIYLFVTGSWVSRGSPGTGAGRRLAAWAAVFTCGTAIEFHEYSRIVLTDVALTFVVTLSLFLFWRAWQRPGSGRWLAFLVAAAFAFYAKGPIGPALIWSSVGVFLLWKRRFRLLAGLAVAYIPIVTIVVVPWVVALYHFGGEGALRFAFWDNQVGRFFRFSSPSLPHDPFFMNKEPFYYYVTHLPAYLTPWTLLFIPTFVAWWQRSSRYREPFHVFVTSAVAGMFLLLHASTSKVVNYALPTYPFLFMMVGVWLSDVARRIHPTRLERWCGNLTAWGVVGIFSVVPVVFVAGTLVQPDLFRVGGRVTTVAGVVLAGLLLALVVTAAAGLYRLARSAVRPLAFGLAPAAFALVAMVALQLVTPVIERDRSYKPFVTLTAEEATHGRAVALAEAQESDIGAFTFYLDRRLPILKDPSDVVAYVKAPEPRAVIVPTYRLAAIEAALAAVPHARLQAGVPGTVSRSFVLLVNQPQEEAAGTTLGPKASAPMLTAQTGGGADPSRGLHGRMRSAARKSAGRGSGRTPGDTQ
jgi:4-amino-4-deoxy-L-arabinose transferase-like glycosyltransferase